MTVTLVAAVGANGVIGVDGDLPWRLPEDLKHFKALTLGHPMVMGRATFDSIGRALPGRTTIVVTRNPEWSADGVEVAPDLDSALARAHELDGDIFIVGGGQIYAQALDSGLVDLMVITRVAAAPDGDVRFPPVDWERWVPVVRIPHGGDPSFEIVTYQRS
ncbi:MAG: dihydrofolate reductase [Aeromicrobium sp.]